MKTLKSVLSQVQKCERRFSYTHILFTPTSRGLPMKIMRFLVALVVFVAMFAAVVPVKADTGPDGTNYLVKVYDENKEEGESIYVYYAKVSSEYTTSSDVEIPIQDGLNVDGCGEPCVYKGTLPSGAGVTGRGFWVHALKTGEYELSAKFVSGDETIVVTDTLTVEPPSVETEYSVSKRYVEPEDFFMHRVKIVPTQGSLSELTIQFGSDSQVYDTAQIERWDFAGSFDKVDCIDWRIFGTGLVECHVSGIGSQLNLLVSYRALVPGEFSSLIAMKKGVLKEISDSPRLSNRQSITVGYQTYLPFLKN